ncbi:MAG: ATP-dependent helicase HrpB [Pseudomonadota bacterium]
MTLGPPLPIDDALPDLLEALRVHRQAVLAAPPGAGKTTRVPLAMLNAGLSQGRIIMLEPRRLAAHAAATRMAETLGEKVGETVGYRMRGATAVSNTTRIEVVTEGILTRMLQTDPDLTGIGALLFDEIHERSLNADLGLALAIEVRGALRPDLILCPMSATLDPAQIAKAMGGAPIIASEGRAFHVEIRWLDRPTPKHIRLDAIVADAILAALEDTKGDVLVFLPGEGDIHRTAERLAHGLPDSVVVHRLFGRMAMADQRRALAPDRTHRKVVLATAIAETSLTIEGVRVVIDAGRARRARFDPGSGMTRLVTERVSRAEADQRSGRAGRTAPGVCYRLWTKGEEGGLDLFPPPEIETADLAGLALDMAVWGARAPGDLPLPSPAPKRAFGEAQTLLQTLGALDENGAATGLGRAMARLPAHPRLARMVLAAGPDAAPLAALLSARSMGPRDGADLAPALTALARPQTPPHKDIAQEARRLTKDLTDSFQRAGASSPAEQLALAYPDRIAKRRSGSQPRYLLANGTGAVLADNDTLADAPYLVIADTDGHKPEPRIRAALAISEAELRAGFADQIETAATCAWDDRAGRVTARQEDRFGALVLSDAAWSDAPPEALARAMLAGITKRGLTFTGSAAMLLTRARLAALGGADLPELNDAHLTATANDWLLDHLTGLRSWSDWTRFDPTEALKLYIGWAGMEAVNRAAPAHWTTPLGRRIKIDYTGQTPGIEVRLQELFGQTTHPTVAGQPLRVTLLSPAGRPVQVTLDLPGFWQSSYRDVRKDMRGRYPKHPWPEDPTRADPTLRAKPRKS